MKQWIYQNSSKIVNKLKLLSLELIIVIAAFFSSVFLIIFLIKDVFIEKTGKIDEPVFKFISGYTNETNTQLMQVFTFVGSHYFLIPANLLLVAYTLYIRKDNWFAIKIASVAITSLLMMSGLKLLFNRPRPLMPLLQHAAGYSFPSGHTFMSFTFFGLLIYIVNHMVSNISIRIIFTLFFLCMILLVGISRIYLRVHYATDVMAGLAIGIVWLVLSLWVLYIIENNKTKLPSIE